jgi:uncharacterized membrane protein YbaN (DUF454 family)
MRPLLFTLGCLLFCLGFVGAFVPVLPTTPFMLLALWCFSRSSERFHDWLYHHKVFGPPMQQWHKYRVIPRGAKAIALLFMTASVVYIFGFSDVPVWVKAAMGVTVVIGVLFIVATPSTPPEKPDQAPADQSDDQAT